MLRHLLTVCMAWCCSFGIGFSQSVQKSDEQLLDEVQKEVFGYFWTGAEPTSGMACERIHLDGIYPDNDRSVVTSGGSGFGVMAILVGIERGFVSREEGVERLSKIVGWLEKADHFHGVAPHWWNGETGRVKPFSAKDDGGDLVETAYLYQGLLAVRQYLRQDGNPTETALANRIDTLWRKVEWTWHQGPNKENVLYWHWSPKHDWEMHHAIRGWNECLITYVLAASSPTHAIGPEVYHQGWASNGSIKLAEPNSNGIQLAHPGAGESGGPLFWAHYSFLGLDPRGLRDRYADYWEQNRAHVMANYRHCVRNPRGYFGYGESCWGLTASYSSQFYSAHSPDNDLGVISPTAAVSSLPYSPTECMQAIRHFHSVLGADLVGEFGFYDAFSQPIDWFPRRYLAIDQGPMIVMIENHRSGLLWNLFMSAPEVQLGLSKLGFDFRRPESQ